MGSLGLFSLTFWDFLRLGEGQLASVLNKAKVQKNIAAAKLDAYCFLFSDASRYAHKNHWDRHVWNNRLAPIQSQ
jgi:hypothetical protein